MSSWRITSIFSCAVLTAGLWIVAVMHPSVPVRWPFWPLLAWGAWGLVSSMMSSEPKGQRLNAVTALLLLASVWLVQELQLLMPEEAWRMAGQPAKPDAASLQLRLVERSHHALSLQWIVGLSRPSWVGLLLGLPLCVLILMNLSSHIAVPRVGQRLAQIALVFWATAVALYTGVGLNSLLPDAPWWFWLLLLALLPFQFKSAHAGFVMVAWLVALAALVCMLLDSYLPLTLIRDAVVAIAMLFTACCGLVWFVYGAAMARADQTQDRIKTQAAAADAAAAAKAAADFDLQAHLDSPKAQEGADKYTRE